MKYKTLLVIFVYCSLIFPANSQTTNDHDFCRKFPLNSRCQDNSIEKKTNSDERLNSDENNIVDTLTIDALEKYLRELGYIDLKIIEDDNAIDFFMQGIPCTVFLTSDGKGIYLYSFYFKGKEIPLEALNDWNKSGYSIAYSDLTSQEKKEFVGLITNLVIAGGVTEERIKSFFTAHAYYQAEFNQYLEGL